MTDFFFQTMSGILHGDKFYFRLLLVFQGMTVVLNVA